MAEGTVAMVLERDVASVFKTAVAVNSILRSAVPAMTLSPRPKRTLSFNASTVRSLPRSPQGGSSGRRSDPVTGSVSR